MSNESSGQPETPAPPETTVPSEGTTTDRATTDGAPHPGPTPRGLLDLDASTPEGRLRLALAFVAVVVTALVLGLLAGTCWGGSPEPPLEELGLGSVTSPSDAASGDGDAETGESGLDDPEQQAFAERHERELASRQSEPEPGSTVPDFTDHALVQELAGIWRLDLGRGRRGYQVRFGTDAVRKVHRERFDVTLFDVVGRGLPPYFTVLDLPDGKLLAFLDAAGTFRLVLEDVRRESDGRLSWRGALRERRYGTRLDGESPWRYGRERQRDADQPSPRELEPREPSRFEDERDDLREREVQETPAERPSVGVRETPEPVPAAVRDRLYEELERHLDELAFGLMERDAGRVFALWGGRPDRTTQGAVSELLERYVSMRVWTRVLALEVESTEGGPQARFEVVVTLQGAPKGARNRRDVDLRDIRWRGRLVLTDGGVGVELDPFQG